MKSMKDMKGVQIFEIFRILKDCLIRIYDASSNIRFVDVTHNQITIRLNESKICPSANRILLFGFSLPVLHVLHGEQYSFSPQSNTVTDAGYPLESCLKCFYDLLSGRLFVFCDCPNYRI